MNKLFTRYNCRYLIIIHCCQNLNAFVFHQKLLDLNLLSILLTLAITGRLAHFNTMFVMSVRSYDFKFSTGLLTYFYLTTRVILLLSVLDAARTIVIDSSSPASAPRFLAVDDMVAIRFVCSN